MWTRGGTFGPFWSVKYLNFFYQKLPTWTAHHTFLESGHPEVTKNLYHVLPTRRSHFLGSFYPFFRLQLMDYMESILQSRE